ncbi:MAG: Stk1 family PASTA domain-containing Ser/Thr kinase [Bacillota bacterium]
MIGKILGNRYRMEERIGGGGMALVYRAYDLQLNREVAVKVLRGQFGSDEEFVRRFRREAQNAASLSHPNIVQIYDVGEENDTYYIVMELVTGKTLKAVIQEQGPLPVTEAARIAIEIADALAHAHAQRIVHRDIKPHNILIARDGRVKVTDFGIARATTTDTVTHTGSIMGSAHYFSPEQANGQPTGEKSDLYSLGVVLYEMVTGTVPFQGDSPITVALKHLREHVVPPSELNPEVPVELDEIILQAMEKEPDDRYESAIKMRQALERFIQLHTAGKTHMNAGDFPTMDIRMAKTRKAKTRAEREAEAEERRERRNTWIWVIATALVVLGGIAVAAWGVMRFLYVPEVKVPPIERLYITQASQELGLVNLKLEVVGERHSDLDPLYVISADPAPGTWVKEGATIQVIVSKGPETVELPDVRGQTYEQARLALENARFQVNEPTYRTAPEPEGQVIEMSPPAKTPLKVGSRVDLVISSGPLKVPVIYGKTLTEATRLLAEAGLQVGNVELRPDPRMPKDTVLTSSPLQGDTVSKGQKIDLVVSLGNDLPGTPFTKELTVPGDATQTVKFQVILVDVIGGAPSERLLEDRSLTGGQKVQISDKFYGEAYLIVKVNGVERGRVPLP